MNRRLRQDLEQKRHQLQAAQAEMEELQRQLRSFESLVDAHLGDMLDKLSELNAETYSLDTELREIREKRLFGEELIRYLDGAPRPARPLDSANLPPLDLPGRKAIHAAPDGASLPLEAQDIKALYRKLARRNHPDLARTDADRLVSTQNMSEINQAFRNGDLAALLRIAGITIPYGLTLPQPSMPGSGHRPLHLSEQGEIEAKLAAVRGEIDRLSRLPILKLSLDVKLARHQRRDLLAEMSYDLQRKVARKIAERDYLHSQINACS